MVDFSLYTIFSFILLYFAANNYREKTINFY